jgi:hypothetical protein
VYGKVGRPCVGFKVDVADLFIRRGGNALLGMRFDVAAGGEVCAYGTACKIEKEHPKVDMEAKDENEAVVGEGRSASG